MEGWLGLFWYFGGGALQAMSLSWSVVLFKPNMSDKEFSVKNISYGGLGIPDTDTSGNT